MTDTTHEALQIIQHMQDALSGLASVLSDRSSNKEEQMKHMSTIQAGFGFLEAAVVPKGMLLSRMATEFGVSFTLGTVVDLGIAELITACGDGGVAAEDIEKARQIPAAKVSRMLRLLAGRGIFKELRPDIWAHSALSRELDSGLTFEEVRDGGLRRYAKTKTTPAYIAHVRDNCGPTAAATIRAYREEKYRMSYSPTVTPFNVALKTDMGFWEWLEKDGGGARVPWFARGMELFNTVGVRLMNVALYFL